MHKKSSANIRSLLDGLLEQGISYVAAHLRKTIKNPIMFTDVIGRIHYPDVPGSRSQLEDLFIELPYGMKDKEHYYDASQKNLYLRIGKKRGTAYIIVTELSEPMVAETLSKIDEDSRIAVKHYFYNLEKLRENESLFKRELVEYLFFKSQINIRDYIKTVDKELQLDKPYLVAIMEADDAENQVDWEIIGSYTANHLSRTDLEIIPVPLHDSMLSIFPTSYKKDTVEIDPDWMNHIELNSYKFRNIINRLFKDEISITFGQPYKIDELHKSYNEARIAMTLTRLTGKKSFVQGFNNMGVFTLIFSRDIDSLTTYASNTLHNILDYDHKNKTELLSVMCDIFCKRA